MQTVSKSYPLSIHLVNQLVYQKIWPVIQHIDHIFTYDDVLNIVLQNKKLL
jgi:hypothetical protein